MGEPGAGMILDVAPLHNAVARLEEGLARYRRDPSDEQIRDGLIQRFEFTYELSHRLLKRYLRQTAATPDEFDRMAFADLIRSANERALLAGDWGDWRRYRDMRARTSHTYEPEVAVEVVAGIPEFLGEARFLADELRRRGWGLRIARYRAGAAIFRPRSGDRYRPPA